MTEQTILDLLKQARCPIGVEGRTYLRKCADINKNIFLSYINNLPYTFCEKTNLLEVGFGSWKFRNLLKSFPEKKSLIWTGLDHSWHIVSCCSKTEILGNICDANLLEIFNSSNHPPSFDYIVSFSSVMWWEDIDTALKNCYKLLIDQGSLTLGWPMPAQLQWLEAVPEFLRPIYYQDHELIKIAKQQGFLHVKTEAIDERALNNRWYYLVTFRKTSALDVTAF